MANMKRKGGDFKVIPVSTQVRDRLVKMKKGLSYDNYLRKRLGMKQVVRPVGRPRKKATKKGKK